MKNIQAAITAVHGAVPDNILSNADLVLQAHLLERELFIAIWIVIFALLTMYLLGFIKFAHDSDL